MIIIGVDIGQKVDPTAICVAECERRGKVDHFLIRALQRLPLGTPYPAVADAIARVAADVERRTNDKPYVYVDATGVGQPVVDILDERAPRVAIVPVFFVATERRSVSPGPNGRLQVSLGKAYMVSRLQALLQMQRLHLPATREAHALAQELRDYELRIDDDGHDRYGAFRVGAHDDLVTALGLAVHKGPRRVQVF